jgi:ATP-dependent RNA helicase HelY
MSQDRAFELDRFQVDAITHLDAGRSVVVAAPTGAGKTVVAEHAVATALKRSERAFYTTPIKALSNQKFQDLRGVHGPDEVGLLTGDNSIRGDADVVVMTTEVLRNMLYERPESLDRLGIVVLDEVHYLQDSFRGPVWEEVIIHLPRSVQLVCLSATVSNAAELTAWISQVRGPTDLVEEHRRPVPLEHLYAVGEKRSDRVHVLPVLQDGKANREGDQYDAEPPRKRRKGGGGPRKADRPWVTPRRAEVIELLAGRDLLPVIYFLFSRAGCSDAAAGLFDSGVVMTDAAERNQIDEIVEQHLGSLTASEREVLGFVRWRDALRSGIASHHAGLVPPFKEAVEACFLRGLVKAVFATETLALGINMPARSIVIERLTKFTGEGHEFLTPGQYTQLAGRAGRRGIDTRGEAMVLWSPWVPFQQVATLASSREFELRSAFRPTYNMATNLVRRHEPAAAHELFRASFAQFQRNAEVHRLEIAASEKGEEARRLRGQVIDLLPEGLSFDDLIVRRRRRARRVDNGRIEAALQDLRPGQLVEAGAMGLVAVLSVAQRGGATHVRVIDLDGTVDSVRASALRDIPRALGSIDLPSSFDPTDPGRQAEVLEALSRAELPASGGSKTAKDDRVSTALRRKAEAADRSRREAARLTRAAEAGSGSLDREFESVLKVLEAWDYLDGWSLTDRGSRLARFYHEADLLAVEALVGGLFDDLTAAELAGMASCLTYEHRSADPPPPPRFPSADIRERVEDLLDMAADLNALEAAHDLPATSEPDPTFLGSAIRWADGEGLAEVLLADQAPGDFVRHIKLLVDLLGQISDAAPNAETRARAQEAADLLLRDVVGLSSSLWDDEDLDDAPGATTG